MDSDQSGQGIKEGLKEAAAVLHTQPDARAVSLVIQRDIWLTDAVYS